MRLSPESLRRLRRQKEESDARAEAEFGYVVERIGDEVPDWRDHPVFTPILRDWYAPHSLSLPRAWLIETETECRAFFERLPWPPREDATSISLSRCRALLGASASALEDGDVRFVRDQLYALAALLLDSWRVRPK